MRVMSGRCRECGGTILTDDTSDGLLCHGCVDYKDSVPELRVRRLRVEKYLDYYFNRNNGPD